MTVPVPVVVLIVIAAAFAAAGPAELSIERLCTAQAPTARACQRL
jgi:hypothetical protein